MEKDRAVFKLDIRPESCNPYGLIPRGALYTLADTATGAAAHSDGRYYVTQTSALHFLRNQATGTVRASAWVRHRGKSTVLTAVGITGEGGALLFQDENYLEKAEILREKGTNRSKFFRGQIDKYTWIDYGSSYLPSDMNAAYLLAELEEHEKIDRKRMAIYNYYHEQLRPLAEAGKIEQPVVPEGCVHNAHMYFIKARNLEVRTKLINYMKERGVMCVFHYVPLHTSPAGQKFGVFHGEDKYTTKESERLMRLPMFYSLSEQDMAYVVECLMDFKEW